MHRGQNYFEFLKERTKSMELFWVFMDLEKVYDCLFGKIADYLRLNGIGGNLLNVVKSFM